MREKSACFSKELLWREYFQHQIVVAENVRRHLQSCFLSAYLKILETDFSNLFENHPNGEHQRMLSPFVKNTKMQCFSN